jgi:hypothetical protein
VSLSWLLRWRRRGLSWFGLRQRQRLASGNARGNVTVAQSRLDAFRRDLVGQHAQAWREHAERLRAQAEDAGDETVWLLCVRLAAVWVVRLSRFHSCGIAVLCWLRRLLRRTRRLAGLMGTWRVVMVWILRPWAQLASQLVPLPESMALSPCPLEHRRMWSLLALGDLPKREHPLWLETATTSTY